MEKVYAEGLEPGRAGITLVMKWRGRGGAGRIEDRRGTGGGSLGGGSIPIGKVGGGGIGTILLVLLFLFISSRGGGGLGIDPGTGQF